MRYQFVTIKRSETETLRQSFLPWEIPIIEAVHASADVVVLDEYEGNDLPYPTPEEEFERLATRYRGAEGSSTPHVSQIYGQGSFGVKALSKAIEDAEEADDEDAQMQAAEAAAPRTSGEPILPKKAVAKPVAKSSAKATPTPKPGASKAKPASSVKAPVKRPNPAATTSETDPPKPPAPSELGKGGAQPIED